MQFRVLGPAGVYDDVRQRSVVLNSPKQRVLLGALLVRMGSPVPTDELIHELWGHNAPDKAGNALQAHVSRLRQQLIEVEPSRANSPRLVARGPGYLLQARPDELDSVQFRLQVTRAQRQLDADPHSASVLLRKALKLWRGPALDGGSRSPLCAAAAARLEEERLLALEDLCDAMLRMGQHRQAVVRLEELVAAHPLRARFRDQLAVALQRSGRQSEARAVHDTPRRHRAAEPGGTGSAAGRASHVRLLRDPAPGRPEPAVAQAPPADPQLDAELVGHPGGHGSELFRLRLRVDELTAQQHTLRGEVERLMALVEERTLARSRDSA